jgi:hypothetical protein
MTTSEDVFKLYDRNKNKEYNDCIKLCKPCPNLFSNVCYCDSLDPVLPTTIGEQDIPCRLKVKIYIKPGEECSICLESINHKSNAHLTTCGHSFHKTCIFKVFESKWIEKRKTPCSLNCPMCRKRIYEPEFEKYSFYSNNTLDQLENFWITKNFQTPKFCFGKNHFIGMKPQCNKCREYINTGTWCEA